MTSSRTTNKRTSSNRLALGASIAAALLSGYGTRQAVAGSCAGSTGTYLCTGAAGSDTTQTLNSGSNPLTVTTSPSFGINVASGHAFSLSTTSTGLSFTDNYSSSITGSKYGIRAQNSGTGATTITTTGTVTGTNGIHTSNTGTGATIITTTGTVTGTTGSGVSAYNAITATSLTINTAAVSGAQFGIRALNVGTGATTITSTGTVTVTVTGAGNYGSYARNNGTATDITISAVDVSGNITGIRALNFGTGATSITSTGTVTGTNISGSGIQAFNNSTATSLTINATDVIGEFRGIFVQNTGTGTTTITVNGAVTGGTSAGIASSGNSNAVAITLNSGASVVSVTSGNAIIDDTGSATVTLNTGASVTGSIALGAGTDAIVLAGGNFSGITSFDGGAGTNDSLTFSGSTGVFDQAKMINTESVIIDSGSTMGLTFTGNAFNASALTGSVLTVQNGGILNATNGFTLTGDLVNSTGVVSMQNGVIDTAATITGHFTGGGQLLIDANFATNTADKLVITGNVLAGGTQIKVNDISTGPATGAAITLVSVGGTTAAGDFVLANNVVRGAFDYNTLALVGSNWVLQSVTATTGAPVFTPFSSSFEALGQSLLTLEALPSFSDRTRNRMTGASTGDDTGIDAPVWMRVVGGKRKIDSRSSTTGTNFNTNHWQAQIGADFTLTDTATHQFVLGVNAGYGRAKTDVSAVVGNSKIDTTSYDLGLSGTWFVANGAYVDLQAQRSWYDTDLSASGTGAGNVNGVKGDGYSASVEVGHAIVLSESLQITPQAQLTYATVNTDAFTGANAEIVKLTDSKSLKARMGAELNKQFTEDGATHGFILANVIHEFKDKTQVNVSGTQLANSVDKWSGELGAGITHAWDAGVTHYELFAAVTTGTSLNNVGNSNSVQGEVGFKANF